MQGIRSKVVWLIVSAIFFFGLSACGDDKGGGETGTIQLAATSSVDPDPADPADGTEPSEPVDPADPVDDPINPDPTDDPADPAHPADPVPADPFEPAPMLHNFAEIVISIKEIRAVPSGGEGDEKGALRSIVAYDTPKRVNVLDLAFVQELLGEAELPAGIYSQLRLVLEPNSDPLSPANYIVLADDPTQKIALNTPSGQESGLKIVGGFSVEAEETTTVLLDFDPLQAIVEAGESGKWQLKPTGIRVVTTENILPSYGTITGRVESELEGEDGSVLRTAVTEVEVIAVAEGSTAVVAVVTVDEDGSFRLLLPAGFYELRVTAGGNASFSSNLPILEVVEGEATYSGVILLESHLGAF
jgi:hypothetical protein